MLTIIAALSRNHVIGHNNALPWYIPGDLKHFKELTLHHTILMGRKTYESIGSLLPHRHTLILSSTLQSQDICIPQNAHSSYTLLKDKNERNDRYITHSQESVFIVWWGEIYKQFLPLVDRLELTLVDKDIVGDTYFPEITWHFKEIKRMSFIDPCVYHFISYIKTV